MALTLPQNLNDLLERTLDRQVRLAVTGLSQAGKTAFLTSLVNQLRHAGLDARLDLLTPVREGRILGAQRINQPDLSIPRFPYDEGIAALSSAPPRWPEATRGISELRLSIRYRSRTRSRHLLGEQAQLTLDLIDYPGEWLLDLPLLKLDYLQWCERMAELMTERRKHYAAPFLDAVAVLDPTMDADEQQLAELAARYAGSLHKARNEGGYTYVQPGRFLLPGELAGAPVLQFFPLPDLGDADRERFAALPAQSIYKTLEARFEHYKRTVVGPFYRDYFRRFDRQIVLVDVLSALNAGPDVFGDLRLALSTLMQSFDYGRRSLVNRLFNPRIDRLAIAATKADHVTPEQHPRLLSLVEALLAEPIKDLRYADVPVRAFSLAAIRATEARTVAGNADQQQPVLKGTTQDGEDVLLFPGDVPEQLPDADFWQRQGFTFTSFRPAPFTASSALPHIRMDAALDWLLGDKLR
ncbi:YcjX family GTP-binding protein [Phytohalomonas tamaricis]|uniref:YcjX family protein n=1 Tax=Phytohalomonas tamaricis TaxID=2081032 RepID=UPI000D0B73D2|nr:YcjX family protein [Phytohalomonas tamaricis]